MVDPFAPVLGFLILSTFNRDAAPASSNSQLTSTTWIAQDGRLAGIRTSAPSRLRRFLRVIHYGRTGKTIVLFFFRRPDGIRLRRFCRCVMVPPAFDVLRGLCMVLIVAFHSLLPYVDYRVPGCTWIVHERERLSPACDFTAPWLQSVALAAFFVMSGHRSARLDRERGPARCLAYRARRLLLPAVAAGPPILLLTAAVWTVGWWLCASAPVGEARLIKIIAGVWCPWPGSGHLWFVEYLCCLCFAQCALSWLINGLPRGVARLQTAVLGRLGQRLTRPWGILVPLAACTALYLFDPSVRFRANLTFVPDVSELAHYGICFTIGMSLFHGAPMSASPLREERRERVNTARGALWRSGWLHVLLSGIAQAIACWLLQHHFAGSLTQFGRLALAATSAGGVWLGVFGVFRLARSMSGHAMQLNDPHSPVANAPGSQALGGVEWAGSLWRYLARASFWVYLVHVPVVAMMQVVLTVFSWPPGVKSLAVLAGSLILSLGSYHFLGGGRRAARSALDAAGPPKDSIPQRMAA
jgi:hypothetical protein